MSRPHPPATSASLKALICLPPYLSVSQMLSPLLFAFLLPSTWIIVVIPEPRRNGGQTAFSRCNRTLTLPFSFTLSENR